MPMYSFRCPTCGHRFDELLSIDNREKAVCPKCASAVNRVWTGKCSFGAKRVSDGGMDLGDCGDCDECASSGGCAGCSASSCAGCPSCG